MDKNQHYLNGLLTGNEKAILEIFKTCYPDIQSFIVKNNGSHKDAEEIFHVALYQLTASTFEGYLYVVCRNLWRKELNFRKKQVRNREVIELNYKEVDHSNSILEQERWELFEEKIGLLSENCRQLLKDYFNKTSYKVIVEKFNYASENVAFQRVFKCKKRLAELIKKDNRFTNLTK